MGISGNYAELAAAVATIALAIVTVWATLKNLKKEEKLRLSNKREKHLESHNDKIMQYLLNAKREISNLIADSNYKLDGFFLSTPREKLDLENNMVVKLKSENYAINNIFDDQSDVGQHRKSGETDFRDINISIDKIKSLEEQYKEVSNKIQRIVTRLYHKIEDNFPGWLIRENYYDNLPHMLKILESYSPKFHTVSIKTLLQYLLLDIYSDYVFNRDKTMKAPQKALFKEVHGSIFIYSTTTEFSNIAQTQEVMIVHDENQNKETVTDLKKFVEIYEEERKHTKPIFLDCLKRSEIIISNYKELMNNIDILLNKWNAGMIVKGECASCILIRNAKADQLRPN